MSATMTASMKMEEEEVDRLVEPPRLQPQNFRASFLGKLRVADKP